MKLPIVMHPTRVLLVDDSIGFYENIVPLLSPNRAIYEMYSNPVEALDIVNESKDLACTMSSLLSASREAKHLHSSELALEVDEVVNMALSQNRMEYVSTVVVDFEMPQMNGIEFCQKIENKRIQKIMFTGKADEHLAVEAFNKGIIHGFLTKGDADSIEELNKSILKAQNNYFLVSSGMISNFLELNYGEDSLFGCLKYYELIEKIIMNEGIVEYYPIEGIGSLLMIDAHGNKSALFIRNEDHLQAIEGILEEDDELKAKLKNREKMLCYKPIEGETLPEVCNWGRFLKKANPIVNGYYYAVSKETNHICSDKILSVMDYVKRKFNESDAV